MPVWWRYLDSGLQDMISFLDLYGLINARVISHGRDGKTREISGSLPQEVVSKLIGSQPM
jgi:archaeal cell division control protein 6